MAPLTLTCKPLNHFSYQSKGMYYKPTLNGSDVFQPSAFPGLEIPLPVIFAPDV